MSGGISVAFGGSGSGVDQLIHSFGNSSSLFGGGGTDNRFVVP